MSWGEGFVREIFVMLSLLMERASVLPLIPKSPSVPTVNLVLSDASIVAPRMVRPFLGEMCTTDPAGTVNTACALLILLRSAEGSALLGSVVGSTGLTGVGVGFLGSSFLLRQEVPPMNRPTRARRIRDFFIDGISLVLLSIDANIAKIRQC